MLLTISMFNSHLDSYTFSLPKWIVIWICLSVSFSEQHTKVSHRNFADKCTFPGRKVTLNSLRWPGRDGQIINACSKIKHFVAKWVSQILCTGGTQRSRGSGGILPRQPPENFESLGYKWWHLMHFQNKVKNENKLWWTIGLLIWNKFQLCVLFSYQAFLKKTLNFIYFTTITHG